MSTLLQYHTACKALILINYFLLLITNQEQMKIQLLKNCKIISKKYRNHEMLKPFDINYPIYHSILKYYNIKTILRAFVIHIDVTHETTFCFDFSYWLVKGNCTEKKVPSKISSK